MIRASRITNSCLSTTAALAMLLAPLKASAAAVSFAPQPNLNGGAVLGRVPLANLGSLTLPRGRAYFKSNIVEITAVPEFQFDREQVLSGPILKCWSTISGKTASINGIAYFQEGEWIKYIDENAPDKVVTSNDTYVGQITAMKNGMLEVTPDLGTPKQIPIADVQQIISPRAYSFSLPVSAFLSVPQGQPISGETTQVTMKPTSRVIALSAVKRDPLMRGDGDVSNKKLVALWAGLEGVQLAQFIPLAILEGPIRREYVQQYHSRIAQSQQFSNFQSVNSALYQNSNIAPGANPYIGNVTP
jgi:hypothetical protein